MKTNLFTIPVLMLFLPVFIKAQTYSIHQNSGFDQLSRALYRPGVNIHTSIKPYRLDQIGEYYSTDSLIQRGIGKPARKMHLLRRFVHDDFLKWSDSNITVRINPLFNFEAGRELPGGKNTWVNTRGVMLEGQLGKNLSFYADFYENQAVFPQYLTEYISGTDGINGKQVVPGQSRIKEYGDGGYDFSQSNGYISYNAGRWTNLQLGFGKNFIGDGYRSLLLSDNTAPYTFLKMTATFWKVKYWWMVAQFQQLNFENRLNDDRFEYKYGAFHFLDWNFGKRFTLGIFESVIWAADDELGHRGLDFNYMVPLLFYRPVEFGLGSPDNMVIGINTKFITWKNAALYGQIILNEFKLDEILARNGWWANKQGYQIGFKAYDFLNIKNLDVQTEYNQVRPFTYTHYSPITNYGHFNQPLAHPLGASFRENVSILRYRYKRWHLELKSTLAIHGEDKNILEERELSATENKTWIISYGGDIFKSGNDRYGSHNHWIGQGIRTNIINLSGEISWLVNPKTNMNIAIGGRYRQYSNEQANTTSMHLFVTLRTSLRNFYYDF